MRILILAALIPALAACTTVPEQIRGDYPDIAPNRVDEQAIGIPVRWGGVILGAQNRGDRTCFEILSRELDAYMRPAREDYSNGRYFACKAGFHDPVVFGKGREVTTTGAIRAVREKNVDEYLLRYPVLEIDTLVLWEKRRQVIVYRGFYDLWYYPYPWGYPYWGYRPIDGGWAHMEQKELLPEPSIIDEETGGNRSDPDNGGNPR